MGSRAGKASYEFHKKTVATVVEPVESVELEKAIAEELEIKDPDNGPEIVELRKENSGEVEPVEEV